MDSLHFEDRVKTKVDRDKMKALEKNPVLNTTGQSHIFKKVVERQQANEYTHISKNREALCFMCYRKDGAMAQNIQICDKCFRKKPHETILSYVKREFYGFCFNCASYQLTLHYVNVRCCAKCLARIAMRTKEWNESGGMYANDPYWQYLRKKQGKDFKLLSNPNLASRLKR